MLRKYSQTELAENSDLAQNVISRIERDQHKPTDATLQKISHALDVEPDVFYYLALIDRVEKNPNKSAVASVLKNQLHELFNLPN